MAPKMYNLLEEEEEKLASAWVTVTEDPDSRTFKDFWAKVKNVLTKLQKMVSVVCIFLGF